MDPVQKGGPGTRAPCFVLTLKRVAREFDVEFIGQWHNSIHEVKVCFSVL